jgi:hypothetical protein
MCFKFLGDLCLQENKVNMVFLSFLVYHAVFLPKLGDVFWRETVLGFKLRVLSLLGEHLRNIKNGLLKHI